MRRQRRLPGGGRLAPDERRVLVVRRHPWFLIRSAGWVLFLLVVLPILLIVTAIAPDAAISQDIGLVVAVDLAILCIALLRWVADQAIPWYSTIYVITNQRVIEQTGVIALRRREVALKRIEESNYSITGAQARFFDYGDLTVRTVGTQGTLVFRMIRHPRRVQSLLAAQVRAYREEIARTAGLPQLSPAELALRRIVQGDAVARSLEQTQKLPVPSDLSVRLQRRLNLLPDEAVIDCQRRHPVVLIKRVLIPVGAFVALLILPFFWQTQSAVYTSLIVGLGLLLWIVWHIIDWANDLYVLTTDRLIELEQTPLFFEMRSVVQLRAVQDVIVTIPTAGARMLNMGHLLIEAGGQGVPLIFRNIPDPEHVQQRIFEAIEALRVRERNREAQRLAGTLSDWFREYHRLKSEGF